MQSPVFGPFLATPFYKILLHFLLVIKSSVCKIHSMGQKLSGKVTLFFTDYTVARVHKNPLCVSQRNRLTLCALKERQAHVTTLNAARVQSRTWVVHIGIGCSITLYSLSAPPGLTIKNSTFYPHSLFVCLLWISDKQRYFPEWFL